MQNSVSPVFRSVARARLRRFATFCVVLGALAFSSSLRAAETPRSLENFARQIEVSSPFGTLVVKSAAQTERPASLAPIELTLEIEKPRKLAPLDDAIPNVFGDFEVVDGEQTRRDATDPDREILVRRLTLYPRRRGTLVFPPFPLRFSPAENAGPASADAGQSATTALLPAATLEIPESDAPPLDVAEIAPDYSPIRVFPVALFLVLTVVVSAFAIAAVLIFQRKRRRAAETVAVESPSVEALRRLDELKNSRLYSENDAEFYPAVASILRRYLRAEFGIDAEEMTTRETLLAVASPPILADPATATDEQKRLAIGLQILKNKEVQASIKRTLTATDLVKFARRPTTFEDAERLFAETRRFVAAVSRRLAAELEKAAQESAADVSESSETPK